MVGDVLDTADTVEPIKKHSGNAIGVSVDTSSATSTQKMAAAGVEAFQKIDILVNNAALMANLKMGPLTDILEDEWDRVMAVNVKGLWQCVKAVLPSMMQQKYGTIVNISSTTVQMGVPRLLHYVTSKGAVFDMTRAMARKLGGLGIRVNIIMPCLTQPQAVKDRIATFPAAVEMSKQFAAQACLGREQHPEDLVGTVLFLAAEDSDFITGQNLTVDGGVVHW